MRSLIRLNIGLAVALAGVLAAGCAEKQNDMLQEAKVAYSNARNDPQVMNNAPLELSQAGETLQEADRLFREDAETQEVTHAAYLARQQVAIARESAQLKVAQQQIEKGDARRATALLESRDRQLQEAQQRAEKAQKDLETAQLRAQEIQTQAQQQELERLRQEATQAQQHASQLQQQQEQLRQEQVQWLRQQAEQSGTSQAQMRQQEMERMRQDAARTQQLEGQMQDQQAQARQQEMERLRQQAARSEQLEAQMKEQQAQAQTRQEEMERLREQAQRAEELEAQLAEMRDVQTQETQRGLVVTLPGVLFDLNKAELKSGAERSIDQLAAVLKDNPERNIVVEGFTDSTGSDEHNRKLSEARATAVRRALVDRGVNPERIQSRGYGESYPIASNETPAGRQLNRRVEIIISHGDERVSRR